MSIYLDYLKLSFLFSIDVRGWTPLHYASRFSDQDTVEFLLQKGFRCDAQTISRYNCLHLAACNKNIGVIKLIWDNFGNVADKNAKDFKGSHKIEKDCKRYEKDRERKEETKMIPKD